MTVESIRQNRNLSVFYLSAVLLCIKGCGGEPDQVVDGSCESGCLIAGECFDAGAVNAQNLCFICDPRQDAAFWSNNDGQACDDGLFCNGADTCSNGTCSSHSGDPCPDDGLFCNGDESCDEDTHECLSSVRRCEDDGVFCNGEESCDESIDACISQGDPCGAAGDVCFEDEGRCCQLRDSLGCNNEGEIVWLDSCGRPEESSAGRCKNPRETCRDGACGCEDGWTGEDCSQCVVYVDGATGSDEDYGRSWFEALATVQAGLDLAEDIGCHVWVAAWTYYPTERLRDREATIQLRAGVHLYGGFAGNEWRSEDRDFELNETTLSGDINRNSKIDSDDSYHVVTGIDDGFIDGFTITGGTRSGGGMYNWGVSPTVSNCTFRGNFGGYGGALYISDASPTIINCTFTGNTGDYGGAIYTNESTPTFTGCTFSENSAVYFGASIYNGHGSITVSGCNFTGNSADRGPGIYNYTASSNVTDSVFSENSGGRGGGIYSAEFSTVVVDNCTFSDNSAAGGGIRNENSTAVVTNCRFVDNTGARGAGIYNNDSTASITNCSFSRNSASRYGGCLFNRDSELDITNSIFTNNSANSGGSIYNEDSLLEIANSTFSNSSAPDGRAIFSFGESSLAITNSILWSETTASGSTISNEDPSEITVSSSDIQGGYPGEGNIDEDPLFVDAEAGDVHLTADSPCIDAGENSVLPSDLYDLDGDGNVDEIIPFDIEGNDRISDGQGDGSEIVDMGAYEFF